MEYLIQQYPNAKKIIVIQDNLNTHKKGSFYEHRQASIAAEMADKLEFHYTPKCSSWLNMIEIEFSAIARTALNKRIPTIELLTEQINAIVKERNDKEIKIKWQFSIETARKTLESKYHKVNKENNWCLQVETNEIFKIKEILEKQQVYLDTDGKTHYDNFDPWNVKKIIMTTNSDLIADMKALSGKTIKVYKNEME